jgi:small conductance mechanosensitive channel
VICSVLLVVPDQPVTPDAPAPTSNQPGWEAVLKTAGGLLTQYGLRVVGALAFLIIAFVVSSFLVRLTVRTLTKAHVDVTLAKFLSNLSRWGLLAVVVLACLEMFGVPATSFVAVLGTMGLAIGLALQGSLAHMAAGVMLLLFRPFSVGDAVTIAGQKGVVDEIELFTTRLDTPDKRRVIIPNGQVFGSIIENTTFHPDRRIDIPVSVAFSADIAKTRQFLLSAAKGVPGRILDREPEAVIVQFGKFSVDWQVMIWVMAPQFGSASQAALQAIKEALDSGGLTGPVPQVMVHAPEGSPAAKAAGALAATAKG